MSEQETSPSPKQQTLTIQQALDLGVEHHNAGRLPEAENIYNQILQTDPNQPDALHFLGVIAYQMGKSDIAVDLIGKALAIKPDFAEAHLNLGFALREQGKLGDAVVSYHKAIEIMPDYAEVLNNPSTWIHKLKLSPLDPPFSKPAPLEYEELYRPGMGTENVGPLLRSLVQMVRPQRILEIGAGYTTPFLLEAVVNNERVFNDGNLNQSYFNNYEYDSKLVVIDDMSLGELAKKPGMKEIIDSKYVDFVEGKFQGKAEQLVEKYGNFDFVWYDCGGPPDYADFFLSIGKYVQTTFCFILLTMMESPMSIWI